MDELTEILRHYGIEKPDDEVETKINNAAFIPEGVKVLKYYGNNMLELFEIDTQVFYMMEYTNFIKIFEVLGFKNKTKEISSKLLLDGNYVIIDFTNLQVGKKDFPKVESPIGSYITEAINNYDDILEDLQQEDPLNKNLGV